MEATLELVFVYHIVFQLGQLSVILFEAFEHLRHMLQRLYVE